MGDGNKQSVRTTGILQNNFTTQITAHLELLNLNSNQNNNNNNNNNNQTDVRIQVLNWGTDVTQTNPVSTILDITQRIAPNTRMSFNAPIPAANHYEVRLTVGCNNNNKNDESVLLNTYARSTVGGGILNGLTVLDSQFQSVTIVSCF
ncbi:hypothetical protein [Brevibacillus sp. NRS-1366]|uniref:hypothetical protein n=1 Tax=Brevibacillus sp. NRS-1366 TaxID=3233899 RepID=UPI003D1B3C78